jgi:hypothetical protein
VKCASIVQLAFVSCHLSLPHSRCTPLKFAHPTEARVHDTVLLTANYPYSTLITNLVTLPKICCEIGTQCLFLHRTTITHFRAFNSFMFDLFLIMRGFYTILASDLLLLFTNTQNNCTMLMCVSFYLLCNNNLWN